MFARNRTSSPVRRARSRASVESLPPLLIRAYDMGRNSNSWGWETSRGDEGPAAWLSLPSPRVWPRLYSHRRSPAGQQSVLRLPGPRLGGAPTGGQGVSAGVGESRLGAPLPRVGPGEGGRVPRGRRGGLSHRDGGRPV